MIKVFDVVNPLQGVGALDELTQAMNQGTDATLILQPIHGGASFTLVVSEVSIEHDALGLYLFNAKADLGVVNGRLWATAPAGQPVGRINITTGVSEK